MIQYLPNALTIFRIALTFLVILLVLFTPLNLYFYLLCIFGVAAATDFFDGFLARKYNVVSDFGKIFDPLSDKVLTFVFLIILYKTGLIPQVIILLLVVRDLIIDGVRGVFAKKIIIPAIVTAKIKTAVIFLLILSALFELTFYTTAEIRYVTLGLSFAALIFSYSSALHYALIFYRARKSLQSV